MRLTSKRQVTFPLATCLALGIKPGDAIDVELVTGESGYHWVLKPKLKRERPWLGMLKKYAINANDHSMEAIRASIQRGRQTESTPS